MDRQTPVDTLPFRNYCWSEHTSSDLLSCQPFSKHYTRMFSVLVRGTILVLFMHGRFCIIFMIHLITLIFLYYLLQNEVWEGYVFTGACLSTRGVVCHPSPRQTHLPGQTTSQADIPWADTPPPGYYGIRSSSEGFSVYPTHSWLYGVVIMTPHWESVGWGLKYWNFWDIFD